MAGLETTNPAAAAAAAVAATAAHGSADPLWAGPPSRPHHPPPLGMLDNGNGRGGGPDPTLPMARVYLRLLAESQQEAAAAKQRVYELMQQLDQARRLVPSKGGAATMVPPMMPPLPMQQHPAPSASVSAPCPPSSAMRGSWFR